MAKALPIPGLTADTSFAAAAVATVRVRAEELLAEGAPREVMSRPDVVTAYLGRQHA